MLRRIMTRPTPTSATPDTPARPSSDEPVSGRARDTRERLLTAGRRAFARKPFASVHLKRDILEPAGVSVGSFYHQFKDKGELLQAIVEVDSAALRARMSEAHEPTGRTPEQIAQAGYGLLFDLIDEEPDRMAIRLRVDDFEGELRRFMQQDAERWTARRTSDYERIAEAYDLPLDPAATAEVVGLLTDGAVRRYMAQAQEDRPTIRPRLIRSLVSFTLHGIEGMTHEAMADA